MAWNFAAGPARLPDEVLAAAGEALLGRGADGASLIERPFTGPDFKAVLAHARQRLAELLDLPEGYHILFLAGGAMQQFSLLPMNLCPPGRHAVYALSGYWSMRAMSEAARQFEVVGFDGLGIAPWPVPDDAAYCHVTANETVDGIACPAPPDTGGVPLVADFTSNFLTAPHDVGRYGVIYASAQKNIGPAGLTVLIVRDDLLARVPDHLPAPFSYRRQVEANSCVNTPPMFAIRMAALVFDWIAGQGGLPAMAAAGRKKADRLYAAVDASGGFYRAPVAPAWRSPVNARIELPSAELTERFVADAAQAGFHHLRGHAQVGGLRVSLYNALPEIAVEQLVGFMAEFSRRHG